MVAIALSAIRASVEYAADATSSASGRYTTAMITEFVNSAIRKYTLAKAEFGQADTTRTTLTTTSSTSLGTPNLPQNEVAVLPADFSRLTSAFLLYNNSRVPLQQLSETDRYDWSLQVTGLPQMYDLVNFKDGTTGLRLWPPSSGSYTLEVLYQNTPTALAIDTDTWNYEYGTEDCIVCDVAMRLLERDGVPEPTQYQALQMRRDDSYERLRKQLLQRDRFSVPSMRDTKRLYRDANHARWFR